MKLPAGGTIAISEKASIYSVSAKAFKVGLTKASLVTEPMTREAKHFRLRKNS